jgi:hypothetical protein
VVRFFAAVVIRVSTFRGVAVLGGLRLVLACGEDESSPESESFIRSCDDPVCCAQVELDVARSRAYLVDGQLELYLATRGKPDPPEAPPDLWEDSDQFEAVVRTDTETTACLSHTDTSLSGLNGQHCRVLPASDVSCGQKITLELRLRTAVYDPGTGRTRCGAVPFTKVPWTVTVTCPECPPEMMPDETCDHPISLECMYSTDVPSCSGLACICGLRSDGARLWGCGSC